jgi:hypothetical protein
MNQRTALRSFLERESRPAVLSQVVEKDAGNGGADHWARVALGEYAAAPEARLARHPLGYSNQCRNLNVGFAHRPLKVKTGIRLSKMIVSQQSFRKRMP